MRLEKIKLSGFKSFVDPTVIPVQGNLTAIVGPNGCGKSNIIDAIRWVMGESSAKHLRGDHMADVIFNGSATRKPVGTASVELVFDNSEGKIGGEYSEYDTIAIKRQVSRDGQSAYFLNSAKCRRKDITDIFLGTGLGSRSYAIIEQGTISRMVEAKPEDLRMHIEEAAGISKYKERRGETQTRIRHTRENLDRLNDLRDEVDKQIKHLQKQAEKAEKYTELKKQERQVKLELLAMRWNIYHQNGRGIEEQLQQVADEHNQLFSRVREVAAAIEAKRTDYKSQQQLLNQVQSDYYNTVSEVSSLEQTIRFNETSHEEALLEIQRSQQQAGQSQAELEKDLSTLEGYKQAMRENETALENALEHEFDANLRLKTHHEQKAAWQQHWENYRTENGKFNEQAEVQRVTIRQLDELNQQLQIRLEKLQAENAELNAQEFQQDIEVLAEAILILETQRLELHTRLEASQQAILDQREQIKHYQTGLHQSRTELQHVKGKITSLELLQQHAMGKDNEKLNDWLANMGLSQNPRLAEFLEVAPGWENAVETVLSANLEAICVDKLEACLGHLDQLGGNSLTLLETRQAITLNSAENNLSRLLDKVTAPWDLSALLAGIYCADDHDTASQLSSRLQAHESVITTDGAWFGPGWIYIKGEKDAKSGLLQREKELRELKKRQQELTVAAETMEDKLKEAEIKLKDEEASRETLQRQHNSSGQELSLKQSETSALNAHFEQQQRRLAHIQNEQEAVTDHVQENRESLISATGLLQEAEAALSRMDSRRRELETENEKLQNQVHQIELAADEARQQVFSVKTQLESLRASENLTAKQIERLEIQQRQALGRIAEIQDKLEQTLVPIDGEKLQLEQRTQEKQELEAKLKQQRQHLDEIESQITLLAEDHAKSERDLEKRRERLDALRLELQESKVRQQSVDEQLSEINAKVDDILATLPEAAKEPDWKIKADDLGSQIERLGTINLTAIEEFQAQSERMKFLNEQHADLTEALETLEQAINKIDKESKLRFQKLSIESTPVCRKNSRVYSAAARLICS